MDAGETIERCEQQIAILSTALGRIIDVIREEIVNPGSQRDELIAILDHSSYADARKQWQALQRQATRNDLLPDVANRILDICYGKPGVDTSLVWQGFARLDKRGLLDAVYALSIVMGRAKD